ncbi:unnamed protein product [Brassica oleracea var. botrytis]
MLSVKNLQMMVLKVLLGKLVEECPHLACFFNGFPVDEIKKYLSNISLEVNHGLEVLDQKSLLSTEHGIVRVHRLRQQMGREIVKKRSLEEPGKPHFLFLMYLMKILLLEMF